MRQSEHCLCPDRPCLTISKPGPPEQRMLITVALHGDEPCGLLAINEMLQDGYFDTPAYNWPWAKLTVLVGNPEAVRRNVRFLEANLNRLFGPAPELAPPAPEQGPAAECSRAAVVASAIRSATAYLDLHSTSAASPPFAFHHPGCAAARSYAAGFPVAYTLDDPTVSGKTARRRWQGTSLEYAQQCGIARAACVECGQHSSRAAVLAARLAIQHFVGGPRPAQPPPRAVAIVGGELVGRGFRWLLPTVVAFQRVAAGTAVAEDERGAMRCPAAPGAQLLLVMPTQAPVVGEDAFLWGRLDCAD